MNSKRQLNLSRLMGIALFTIGFGVFIYAFWTITAVVMKKIVENQSTLSDALVFAAICFAAAIVLGVSARVFPPPGPEPEEEEEKPGGGASTG